MQFSITKYNDLVHIYNVKSDNIKNLLLSKYILCYMNINDECTIYKYIGDDDELFKDESIMYDSRDYHVFNLHEDCQGIDHVGIVNFISGLFTEQHIPILYVNTFSYNLIFVEDTYIDQAMEIMKNHSSILFL